MLSGSYSVFSLMPCSTLVARQEKYINHQTRMKTAWVLFQVSTYIVITCYSIIHALLIDLPARGCPRRFDHQKERSKILIWKSFFCKVQGWRQSFDCLATLSRSSKRRGKKNVMPITVLIPKKSSLKCASCVTAKLSAFRKLMPSMHPDASRVRRLFDVRSK